MKLMKKFFSSVYFWLVTLFVAMPTGAKAGFLDEFNKFTGENNPLNPALADSPTELLQIVIVYITGLSGIVAVAFIIYGGYLYMMAGGNQENTKKATDTISKAVIGLVIILAAWLIITTLLGFFS